MAGARAKRLDALDHADRHHPSFIMSKMPEWLPTGLAVAMHQDQKRAWPWWKRFGHWAVVSWRCPCCMEERRRRRYWQQERNKQR
jgi:hypothetical protein